MATTATKAIAARLPFAEYVRVLERATEAKLSVSDYLILKLSTSERVAQAEAQQKILTQQIRQLKQEAKEQADLAFEQQEQGDAQRIELIREMNQLKQKADTNQQTLQKALEKARVELEEMTKKAVDWETYANNMLKAKTVLEQTIKTHEQTLAQQRDELAQLKAKKIV